MHNRMIFIILFVFISISFCSDIYHVPFSDMPQIIDVFPTNNAEGVDIDTDIYIFFNKELDEAYINSDFIKVSDQDDTIKEGIVTFDNSRKCMIFYGRYINNTNQKYLFSTRYTVHVLKNLIDRDGERVKNEYEFSFTTVEPPIHSFIDEAEFFEIPDGAVDSPDYFTVKFNAIIDETTLNDSTIYVINQNNGNIMNGNLIYYEEYNATYSKDDFWEFKVEDLTYNIPYTLYIKGGKNGIKNLNGVYMLDDFAGTYIPQSPLFPK